MENKSELSENQYKEYFLKKYGQTPDKEADTRAGRALAYAIDIRKFEIELYWKRATYFWTFIAAAFVGYSSTYKECPSPTNNLPLLFSAFGLIFSFAWYLVNRGSKFWQSNWERHVELLEDITLGPLYKTVAVTEDKGNPFTTSAPFSVSKINQLLSVFVVAVWILLFAKELGLGLTDISMLTNYSSTIKNIDIFKTIILLLVTIFVFCLYRFGKSSASEFDKKGLHMRTVDDFISPKK